MAVEAAFFSQLAWSTSSVGQIRDCGIYPGAWRRRLENRPVRGAREAGRGAGLALFTHA